jgi:hypothetical protein
VSTKELERAVAGLPPEEFEAFAAWFEEFLADRWDAQLERDIAAGRLDTLAKRAKADMEVGR